MNRFLEQRATPRFALLLRSAKLVGRHREYPCIIRDVSETGVKLRMFNTVQASDGFILEMATGHNYPAQLVWQSDTEAGFRFTDPIDVNAFIAEAGPYPKRPLRVRVRHDVEIRHLGGQQDGVILDLSRQGAKISTDRKLAIGQRLRLVASGLPEFEATVCWRQHPHYGLVFRQLMSLEELAGHTARMQPDADVPDTPQPPLPLA